MRLSIALGAFALTAAAPLAAAPVEVPVQLTVPSPTPLSGRLIIFAEPAKPGEALPESVDANPFAGTPTAVAAREVRSLSTGQVATVDTETDSVPEAWSKLPPGRYHVQAVLDVDHDYNYGGRGAGDLISPVTDVTLPGPLAPWSCPAPSRRASRPAGASRRSRLFSRRSCRSTSLARHSALSGVGRSTCAARSRFRRTIARRVGRPGRPSTRPMASAAAPRRRASRRRNISR